MEEQKKGFHVFRCSVFTENIGIVKSKKRHTRPQMFCFPLKVSVKKKKGYSLFLMKTPIFSEALGFSLLNLFVSLALCLQPIFCLSTFDICPIYVGFRPTVLASSFCYPYPTNKILRRHLWIKALSWVLISMVGL